MRRALLPLLLLAAVVIAAGGAWLVLHAAAGPEARPQAQRLATGPFHALQVNGHAEVVLVQGDEEALDVDAPAGHQGRLQVSNAGGTLSITAAGTTPLWARLRGAGTKPVQLTVRFRALDTLGFSGALRVHGRGLRAPVLSLRASGAAAVVLDGLDAGDFRFNGSGAVRARLSGQAPDQHVAISGAGDYRAVDLRSERAEVRVSGAGKVAVHATQRLDAAISGAGLIAYAGSPEVRQRISGAGRIRQLSAPWSAQTPGQRAGWHRASVHG